MDALRILDAKTVPYRSTRAGVMHACGHDAHATMVLSGALALWECRHALPESTAWRAIFQPSEEVSEGALEMIDAGAVENVREIVALHVDPELTVGRIAHRTRVLTAFCQEFHVVIRGVGGHAARPHTAVDPIAAAVQLVQSVYQAIPRSVDSREPTVVTFGSIRGGTSANIVPDQVKLKGTIRTLSAQIAGQVRDRIVQIARGVSVASRARIKVSFQRWTDVVDNDPRVTAVCLRAASEVVGPTNLDEIPLPSMGGEDFSGYLQHVPGCLLRLGVASPDRPRHALHSAQFDLDERALAIGAKVLARSVVLLCHPSRSHAG
jgi:amidohydrolase